MPGDIARYHAECAKEPQVQKLLRRAMLNYEKSLEICADAFPLRHPLRRGAIANRVILEYKYLNGQAEAIELVKTVLGEPEFRRENRPRTKRRYRR
jgi:hypothetical protein